jgi:3-dehydroquinate dehydratase/shikimate dehydrogenase
MICVSIAPKNMKEAQSQLLEAGKLADVVEVRIESIADLNIDELLKQPRQEVIITNRSSQKKYSKIDLVSILYRAIEAGAEYVDIEIRAGTTVISNLMRFAVEYGTQLIISHHCFSKTPNDIFSPYSRMKKLRPHIIKLVSYANDICDNIRIFNLLEMAKKGHYRLSCFSMGEKGEISRILAPRFKGYITYCSHEEGSETAQGQIPVNKLLNVYNYSSINEQTKIFGLVGNPVSHSRGIYIHNEFFKINNLNAVYVNFLVDDFRKYFRRFIKYVHGMSITIPHKENAVIILKNLSPEAEATKSVNTIIKTNQRITGYNTDALAAIKILKKKLEDKSVAVLGTGGTARSAIYAAKSTGAIVTVFGRNIKKAKRLSREFACGFSSIEEMGKIKKMDVIINTTPVGMQPDINSSPIPKEILNKNMLVVDFVYTPPVTKLLKDARNCGCEIIPGTKIFKEQAKLQQELFKSVI